MPQHTVATILKKRGIDSEVAKAYNVTCFQSEDGQLWLKFPLVDASGQPSEAFHKRPINLETGELVKELKLNKGAKVSNPLFGWQQIGKQTNTIVVCEGQTDTLSLATALKQKNDVAVVGMVGTANATKAAAQIVRYASKKTIVLAFDNDDAGTQATDKFLEYIQAQAPEITILKLAIPPQFNDVNQWLTSVESEASVAALEALSEAKPLLTNGLVGGEEIANSLLEYIRKLKTGDYCRLKFAPTLDRAVKLLPGKLVGVIGDSGKGKSTFVEHVALEAMAQGFNCFFVSAEMKPEETALKLARTVRGIDYYDEGVLSNMTDEDISELQQFTGKLLNKLSMFARFGTCTTDEIQKKIQELTIINRKPHIVVVDHMLAISSTGETGELENIAKELKSIAERNDCCVILLCHVRKQMKASNRTIYRPQLSDVYNSGGLARYADVVLAVALDPDKKLTMIETVKMERLGGRYADVSLRMVDFQLSEVDEETTVGESIASTENDDTEADEVAVDDFF